VHPDDVHAGVALEAVQASGRGVAVHASSRAIQQDRTDLASTDAAVNGSRDRGWHGYQNDLVSLADDPHDPVPVFFAEVADAEAGGFEDP
jgi:hypothetical protein